MKASRKLVELIRRSQTRDTSPFDTQGQVVRIEGDTAWVHFPGGVDETPVRKTINAKVGDNVQVRVSDGDAFLVGNGTAPPTDDTRADYAAGRANAALEGIADAEIRIAGVQERVSTAEDNITDVEGRLVVLDDEVEEAQDMAEETLKGLALAQDIVGTLKWITDHSAVTTDTTPVSGKSYYIKNADNTFTLVEDTTGKNPAQEGWYEMDEAMANYVASHLALTNEGLYVTADDSGWKLLIKSDGMDLIDSTGASDKKIAQYGSSVIIGAENDKHIEVTPTAFNVYDEDGSTPFAVSTGNSLTTKTTGAGTALFTSPRHQFSAHVYLKGTIENNRVYFGTASSGYPTVFNDYVELQTSPTEFPTDFVTTVVNGVSCSARWENPSIVYILFENTGTSKINVAYRINEVYYETSIKANDALLGVRSKSLLLMSELGSTFDDVCYLATYGHIAQVSLGVYNTSSIPVNAHIYRGILGECYPERPINLIGKTFSSGKLVYGQINPLGTVTVYNTTGSAISTSTSDYIWLTGTYIYK